MGSYLIGAFFYTLFGILLVIGIVEAVKYFWRRTSQHWENGTNVQNDGRLSALTLNIEERFHNLNGLDGVLFLGAAFDPTKQVPIDFVFLQEIPHFGFTVQRLFSRLRRQGVIYNYDIRPELGLALASIYPIEYVRVLKFPSAHIQAAGVKIPDCGLVNLINVKLKGDLKAGVNTAVEFSQDLASWLSHKSVAPALEIMAGDFGFHTGVPRRTLRPAPSNKFLRIVGAGFRDSWPIGKLPASTYSPWGERPARRSYIFTRGKDYLTTALLRIPAGEISDHAGLIATLKIYGGNRERLRD